MVSTRKKKEEQFKEIYCLGPLAKEWYDKLLESEQFEVESFVRNYLRNPEEASRGRLFFENDKQLNDLERGAIYTVINGHDATLAARDYLSVYEDHKLNHKFYNVMGFLANFDIGENKFDSSCDGTYVFLHSRLTEPRKGDHPFSKETGLENFMLALDPELGGNVADIFTGKKLAVEVAEEMMMCYGALGRGYTIEKFIKQYVDDSTQLHYSNKGIYRVMLGILGKKDIAEKFLQLLEDEELRDHIRKIDDGTFLKGDIEDDINDLLDSF